MALSFCYPSTGSRVKRVKSPVKIIVFDYLSDRRSPIKNTRLALTDAGVVLGLPGPLKFGTYGFLFAFGPVGVTDPAPVGNLVAGILLIVAACVLLGCRLLAATVGKTSVLTTVVVILLNVSVVVVTVVVCCRLFSCWVESLMSRVFVCSPAVPKI